MKLPFYLIVWLFLIPYPLLSQGTKISYKKIDSYAKTIKVTGNVGKLSRKLTAPFKTDIEKVRAIFIWITENIEYDTKEFHLDQAGSSYTKIFTAIDPSSKNINGIYEFRLAEFVLNKKKAICAGYANLFKILCDSAGIKSVVVEGYAKNSIKQVGAAFESNHAWNAVMINEKWELLDVTWASGYCDDSVFKFTKKYDESYFLTSPQKMIFNHFPKDPKWFLITNPPGITTFYSYPLIYSGFFEKNISSFIPLNGVFEAKVGNKINLEIRVSEKLFDLRVHSSKGNNEIKVKKQEKVINYEYTITSDQEDQLTVFIDGIAVFAYRIIIVP